MIDKERKPYIPNDDSRFGCETEFAWLKRFASEACFDFEVCRDQLCALWTAYCLHRNFDCDTLAYDNALLDLWCAVKDNEPDTADWSDYESFDWYMCRYLC